MSNLTNALLPFGANELFRNDDSSSAAINVSSIFEDGILIGDRLYSELYVNTNGNITFGGGLSTFTPDPIGTGTGDLAIIAPFWGDVDTRGGDNGRNVYWDFDQTRDSFIVTWHDVGYFSQRHDKLNTFQLELHDLGSGDIQITFRYEDINWTTGGASGGVNGLGGNVARAGFAIGQELDFELPASGRQNAVLSLEEDVGNTGDVGVWTFDTRNGDLQGVGTEGNDVTVGTGGADMLFGNDGNDTLEGTGGNDLLFGGADDDVLYGGAGNDMLAGESGSDMLYGGDGIDTADYLAVSYGADLVSSQAREDGTRAISVGEDTDILDSIERVVFQNGELRFDTGSFENVGAAYRFYTSILDREPDAAGMQFYVGLLDDGVSLFTIAEDISTSFEFEQNFGRGLTTSEFLYQVYENILDRRPDALGLEYWRNEIDTGAVTRAEAIVYISEDTENLENSLEVIGGGYFIDTTQLF